MDNDELTAEDALAEAFLAAMPDDSNKKEFEQETNAESAKIQLALQSEKVEEQKQRRDMRWIMFFAFTSILVWQYLFLVVFVLYMSLMGHIEKIQPLLIIIIPATLGETYAVIRVMVKYVFSPGDYGDRNKKCNIIK